MTPTLLDLALKAGFSDPIEGWMGEAYEERLEAFAKLIIEHEAAKPADEPVAWQAMVEDEAMKEFSIRDMAHDWCVQQKLRGSTYAYWIRPLYTRPQPKREPLTGEMLITAAQSCLSPHQYDHFEALLESDLDAHNRLARAIEASHGITGETK